jgi:hypothetical protein
MALSTGGKLGYYRYRYVAFWPTEPAVALGKIRRVILQHCIASTTKPSPYNTNIPCPSIHKSLFLRRRR